MEREANGVGQGAWSRGARGQLGWLATCLAVGSLTASACSRKGDYAPSPSTREGAAAATADEPAADGVPGGRAHAGAPAAEAAMPFGATRKGVQGRGLGDGSGLDAAAAALAGIDPNGRFATTYRPGGGHLAAFDSAVARGIIPQAERDLVGDVGARYVPDFPPAKDQALAVRLDVDRKKLPPSGGPSFLRITLRSAAETRAARPHLSVHLVLDTSGSMGGDSIKKAREAAAALVDKLDAKDDFSLVTFSDDARVLVADGPVGSRRMDIKKTIEKIQEGGGTNIEAGLALGYAEAKKTSIPSDAIRVVMLVSDGRATMGDTNSAALGAKSLAAFQDGVQTSAFGLGTEYDGPLMSAIAANGAGGYYYLRDGEQIAPALKAELEQRLDPVAQAVEVRVRVPKDVKVTSVYGSRRLSESEGAAVRKQEVAADEQAQKHLGIKKDRDADREGGMRFFMPIFAKNDAHSMLLKLEVPAGVDPRSIASIEVKYKDRLAKKNSAFESSVKVEFANDAAQSVASRDPSVLRTIQGFEAGETLRQAAARVASGDRAGAAALLEEREGILRHAAKTLEEPLFEKDADRLARLRTHGGSTTGLGDPLVLAMLLETASRSHMR